MVYGLFGMVVLVPLIRRYSVAGNSGFGLLSAAIVLAVMILPSITSISEDAIRAVPVSYKKLSLALGGDPPADYLSGCCCCRKVRNWCTRLLWELAERWAKRWR